MRQECFNAVRRLHELMLAGQGESEEAYALRSNLASWRHTLTMNDQQILKALEYDLQDYRKTMANRVAQQAQSATVPGGGSESNPTGAEATSTTG